MQGGKFAFYCLVIGKAVADLNSGFFFRQNKVNLAVGRKEKSRIIHLIRGQIYYIYHCIG